MKPHEEPADGTKSAFDGLTLAAIIFGILLNLGIGAIATNLKIPLYLDAIGTVCMTLLLGWRAGVVVGVASFLLGGLLTNPALPYFAGTQACIAVFVGVVARRGGFRTILRAVVAGLALGVIAAIVSAPVIVYLFGGITGSGVSVVAAFLMASGQSILKSVILSGATAEPIDKTLQVLVAIWILKGLPQTLLLKFPRGYLNANGFIKT